MESRRRHPAPSRRILLSYVLLVVFLAQQAAAFNPKIISAPIANIACTFGREIFRIAAAIALLVIIAAGAQYVYAMDDPGKRKQAKDAAVHALIGLLIIVIANALVTITFSYPGGGSVPFTGCTTWP